jgi:hypothetical protein
MSNDIAGRFRCNDPATYKWAICGSKTNILTAAANVASIAILVPVSAFLITSSAFLWLAFVTGALTWMGVGPGMAGAIFVLWIPIGIMIILFERIVYFYWLAWRGSRKEQLQARSRLYWLLICAIGILTFLMMGPFKNGFHGNTDSIRNWFRFLVDNGLGVILLDTPEVCGIHLSDIQPYAWLTRVATVFLRFLIGAGLVAFLWDVYQRMVGKKWFYGSVKECLWKCRDLPDRDSLQLRRESKIESFSDPEAFVPMSDFVTALNEEDTCRDGPPSPPRVG